MANQKNYTEPKLYPLNRDLKKTWWVEFRYFNPETGKMQAKQFRDNLNELPTVRERIARGKVLIQSYKDLLVEGWNPFSNEIQAVNPESFLPLDELLEHILAIKRCIWTAKTWTTYSDHRKQFTKWLVSKSYHKLLPRFFDSYKAQEYMDYCLSERKYSGRTYNGRLSTLGTFFAEIKGRKLISENPFDGIKQLPEVQSEYVSFMKDERIKMRDHLKAHNLRLYYAVQFVYYCFLRRTELMQLKVGDVDISRKTIRVAGKKSKNKRSLAVTIPKSFEPVLLEMQLDKLPKDYYIFGKGLKTCSTPMTRAADFTDAHLSQRKKLNIRSECTFYSWKHTGAMELYLATKDVYVVMRQCRHQDISITMVYLRSLGLIVDEVVRNADFEF